MYEEMTPDLIETALSEYEEKYGFHVLYAAETGSRCWGMESPDSDYDIRFIYVYPPQQYLKLFQPTTHLCESRVYEGSTLVLDLVGWDLRKTLILMAKSNASLYEMLKSPVIYRNWGGSFGSLMLRSFESHVGLGRMAHHYLGLASGHVKKYLSHTTVSLKKVMYTARCVLAASHILEEGELPPVRFDELISWGRLSHCYQIADLAADLMEQKKAEGESHTIPASRVQILTHLAYNDLHKAASTILDQIFPINELEALNSAGLALPSQFITQETTDEEAP